METKNIKAFGTEAAEAPLKEISVKRRSVTPHDVEIEILYCGICHSDLHSCLLYTSPSPRDLSTSRMPSSA